MIYHLREVTPGRLLGCIEILGVSHHIEMIEVMTDDIIEPPPGTSPEAWDTFTTMQEHYEGAYAPVEHPDFPGRHFVVLIYPFSTN